MLLRAISQLVEEAIFRSIDSHCVLREPGYISAGEDKQNKRADKKHRGGLSLLPPPVAVVAFHGPLITRRGPFTLYITAAAGGKQKGALCVDRFVDCMQGKRLFPLWLSNVIEAKKLSVSPLLFSKAEETFHCLSAGL